MIRLRFADVLLGGWCCVLLMIGRPAMSAEPTTIVFESSGERTTAVVDPAAVGKSVLAVDVGSTITGSHRLKAGPSRLPAGRYRVTLFARLSGTTGDDFSRHRFDLVIGEGKSPRLKMQCVRTQFDSTPNRYTPIVGEATFSTSAAPTFDLAWQMVTTGALDRVRPLRKAGPPPSPTIAATTPKKTKSALGADDDLLAELTKPTTLPSVATIDYPALLIDRVTFEPLGGSQWIESVRPQYLHVYPQQANPIEVVVQNVDARPVEAELQLEMIAGLDDVVHSENRKLSLAAATKTTHRIDWPGAPREFGYEVRATLLVDGKPLHAASEYFSVSFPIWKTALQGSGFIDWYGREPFLAEHVAHNRATYQNVEEAFSWQPSSWTDLNPTTDHWWTGQGDVHNSAAGLKQWIELSHAQGIKMTTYLWPTASGPEGLEWGRKSPELVTHERIGLPTEFFDVEDLRLKSITESDRRLWELRSGIWNYVGVNRGMLRAIETGVGETIRSAKRFGWDGARFDKPPLWSAMSADDMHGEFAKLKAESLMQRLVPEYYEQKSGTWSDEAVSIANVRYARHRFREHDPHFAVSYNHGEMSISDEADTPAKTPVVDALCADGGQIMDEAIRQMTRAPYKAYLDRICKQANITRVRGGHHCCVAPSGITADMRCYMSISLFIGGSHPYGDFGWAQPLPGRYSQFATRYGEFIWDAGLEPTTGEAAGFAVADDATLWWNEYVRRRTTADGREQYVVHLLTTPPDEKMTADNPGPMKPWRNNLRVSRKTSSDGTSATPAAAAPIVWALSAEPTTHAVQLAAKKIGDRYEVELPEHRVWTVLVWTEAKP